LTKETGYHKAILKVEPNEWTIVHLHIGSDNEEYITIVGADDQLMYDDIEEWGDRIDMELHRHRWDRIVANGLDVKEHGVTYSCQCGAMLVPEMDNYHEEAMRMQEYRNTPGAVFQVVEK